jgi:hypothetical protein
MLYSEHVRMNENDGHVDLSILSLKFPEVS